MLSTEELSGIPILAGVPQDDLAGLLALGSDRDYAAGATVFERGAAAAEMYIVCRGAVELAFPLEIQGQLREIPLQRYGRGGFVGWSALVAPYRFTFGARCVERAELTVFRREALDAFFDDHPVAAYRFMRNLAGVVGLRLQRMQTLWVQEIQRNVGVSGS